MLYKKASIMIDILAVTLKTCWNILEAFKCAWIHIAQVQIKFFQTWFIFATTLIHKMLWWHFQFDDFFSRSRDVYRLFFETIRFLEYKNNILFLNEITGFLIKKDRKIVVVSFYFWMSMRAHSQKSSLLGNKSIHCILLW